MDVKKININQSERTYDIASDIYDVSYHNNGTVFESLAALLSDKNLSTLIPTAVRCGGMTIRFVQSSDNKYVQYRLMTTFFSTTKSDWQGVDDEPTIGSDNLVKSGGAADKISELASRMTETSDTSFTPDLSIGDEDGNVIAQFSGGHIKTKNFDSRDVVSTDKKFNYTYNAISKISLTKHKFWFDIKKIAEIGWGNQGFCIYNDYALVFSNQGTATRPGSNFAACKIFKITDNDGTPSFTSVTDEFLLEGYTPNHANTASLGSKYNEDDDFPLMYMPRCIIGSNQNCIVERISLNGTSQKVQEISIGTYRGEVTASSDIQWTTDGKFLYLFGNTKSSYSANGNKFVFCKLNLPNITSGDISVDLNDAIEFYYFEDYGFHNTNVLQGCKVINDMMILPVGFGSSSGVTMSHLYFWDIIHRRLKADINLSALTSGEFEDVEYYKDSLLIFVGGGYIYQLKF